MEKSPSATQSLSSPTTCEQTGQSRLHRGAYLLIAFGLAFLISLPNIMRCQVSEEAMQNWALGLGRDW
jgi:hypothetical protein